MSDIISELRMPTMCYDMAGRCCTESTMEEAADYIEQLESKLAAAEADAERLKEASKLLKEISKVMKADDLHRGNPERRNLWGRISKFRAAIDAARGDK